MKLYICWGTCPVPGASPCRIAHEALEQAGHDPQVIKAHGARLLPDSLAQRLPDRTSVPVLVTDEGDVVSEARNIVAWAKQNPAASAGTGAHA
jgi:hypothetical protein